LYFSANNSLPLYGLVQGQAAIALDGSDQDRSLRNFPLLEQAFNAKAALITPIVARGTVLGLLLSIDSNARRVFTSEEIELLTIFANQAATVLEQARLFHEAEGVRQELADVRERMAQNEKLAAAAGLTGADALELAEPLVMILKRVDRIRKESQSSALEVELQLIDAQTRRMIELAERIHRAAVLDANAPGATTRVGEPPRADPLPE
jgi:GAF domain-containing protein